MSRFPEGDYDDEYANLHAARYEHNLKRALSGRKGQKALKELREALLSLPERRLIRNNLATPAGEVCTVGALVAYRLAKAQGVDVSDAARTLANDDPQEWDGFEYDRETGDWIQTVSPMWDTSLKWKIEHGDDGEGPEYTIEHGKAAGLVETLAWELGYRNDDLWGRCTPEERWTKCLAWVERQILDGIPAESR